MHALAGRCVLSPNMLGTGGRKRLEEYKAACRALHSGCAAPPRLSLSLGSKGRLRTVLPPGASLDRGRGLLETVCCNTYYILYNINARAGVVVVE